MRHQGAKNFTTASNDLDSLLGGGITCGNLYEFYGKDSNSLTELSLMISTRIFADRNYTGTVLYIQAGNVFNVKRLLNILKCLAAQTQCLDEYQVLADYLSRFWVVEVFSWEKLISSLQEIFFGHKNLCKRDQPSSFNVQNQNSSSSQQLEDFYNFSHEISNFDAQRNLDTLFNQKNNFPAVIVIDSIALTVGEFNGSDLQNVIHTTTRLLRKISKDFSAAIVVTSFACSAPLPYELVPSVNYPSYVYSENGVKYHVSPPCSYRSTLGKNWYRTSHIQIQIEDIEFQQSSLLSDKTLPLQMQSLIRATVTKSSVEAKGRYCHLILSNKGISDCKY